MHEVYVCIYILSRFRAGFRTVQAGQLPRGLHNQGASTYVCHLLYIWYSRVRWASTAPLLKAAPGVSQPGGGHHICLVTLFFCCILLYIGRGSTRLNPALCRLVIAYYLCSFNIQVRSHGDTLVFYGICPGLWTNSYSMVNYKTATLQSTTAMRTLCLSSVRPMVYALYH